MFDLSRRGFLTGLLSTAAMIAARPPLLMELGYSPDQQFMEGLSQRVTATYIYSNRTIRVWKDVEAIIDRNILLKFGDYVNDDAEAA